MVIAVRTVGALLILLGASNPPAMFHEMPSSVQIRFRNSYLRILVAPMGHSSTKRT